MIDQVRVNVVKARECIGRARPGEALRMKEMREQFDAVDDARSRPREEGVCVDGVDTTVAHRRKIEPALLSEEPRHLLRGEIESVAARHHYQYLGSPGNDVLPRDAHRVRPSSSER